ncbi:sulfotransferase family protein [Desulfogranum mediterraneum]|uniref:sulfotransferase family protein n=1 Tax=Desulfogranum mediterraneum TaxID=160661 RepID=UPI000410A996|nr:sulfotransferase [Desulfogranum mediterraneum]
MNNTDTDQLFKPDFIIIGAMKCATSTLHDQLAAQPDFFMSSPKEPNFFSNEEVYAQGISWYSSLFSKAQPDQLKGESSTHYTKLPTYPDTVARIAQHCPDVKLIYVMRHPLDRLVSHYIHEWTQGVISVSINQAIHRYPELLSYSSYAMQLAPYIESFGTSSILPVFLERLHDDPARELQAVFEFLEVTTPPFWDDTLRSNVSAERIRPCGWRDALINNPFLSVIRKTMVPKSFRNWVRSQWSMKQRPTLSPESREHLEQLFDRDLAELGSLLGLKLCCQNFKAAVTSPKRISWSV